ncbi:hypothetical protein IRZ81_10935 [Pseudomonas putida]|uniref:hypothetical protein n=1 Tax=Pseudomonas putida TaxID=303 RepID=UPI0018A8FF62|nr:hypothetical protein [Pseudomonas putida]MBF8651316.1 hypothetical protein [Pseudomonas putida]MBF8655012.1 hypothetical protein [Pseudomonas putida]
MNGPAIAVDSLKDTAEAVGNLGYFVDALGKFIATVGNNDPYLCQQALDGYVLGGLLVGLRLAGSELQGHGEHLEKLINDAESNLQSPSRAPRKDGATKRGAGGAA